MFLRFHVHELHAPHRGGSHASHETVEKVVVGGRLFHPKNQFPVVRLVFHELRRLVRQVVGYHGVTGGVVVIKGQATPAAEGDH